MKNLEIQEAKNLNVEETEIVDLIEEYLLDDFPHEVIRNVVEDAYKVTKEAYTKLFNFAFNRIGV
jgi:hypothetical protein